ncbi:hypothetical protein [Comamonas terrigena]|uniref:hypothetical protein n=1 Tax=Comamonas terrigena TaxID=32013 RepID=UPI002449CE4E|nr:hypothetical protein [Comamonas terrigena]MDH1701026.1 hypothetical protein [Comamonas terrigena]
MILLLNLLPYLVVAAGLLLGIKLRKVWIFLAALALAAIYNMAQPSYAPKGTVQRSQVPAFTESSASIEDRNSKPVPGDVRDQRMHDAVHNGLDFKP